MEVEGMGVFECSQQAGSQSQENHEKHTANPVCYNDSDIAAGVAGGVRH